MNLALTAVEEALDFRSKVEDIKDAVQEAYLADVIKKTWILLDTWYIDSMKNNLGYVEYVSNCAKESELALLTNVGSVIFDQKGRLTFYLWMCVWKIIF